MLNNIHQKNIIIKCNMGLRTVLKHMKGTDQRTRKRSRWACLTPRGRGVGRPHPAAQGHGGHQTNKAHLTASFQSLDSETSPAAKDWNHMTHVLVELHGGQEENGGLKCAPHIERLNQSGNDQVLELVALKDL